MNGGRHSWPSLVPCSLRLVTTVSLRVADQWTDGGHDLHLRVVVAGPRCGPWPLALHCCEQEQHPGPRSNNRAVIAPPTDIIVAVDDDTAVGLWYYCEELTAAIADRLSF